MGFTRDRLLTKRNYVIKKIGVPKHFRLSVLFVCVCLVLIPCAVVRNLKMDS